LNPSIPSSFSFSSSNLFQDKPDLKTVLEDKISTRVEKLGPINLDIKPGQRLYEAWDEAFKDEVEGFKISDHLIEKHDEKFSQCIRESWILGQPQVLFFSLKRVKFS
jgi:hypothetical protein